jgi:hypothetical protein
MDVGPDFQPVVVWQADGIDPRAGHDEHSQVR